MEGDRQPLQVCEEGQAQVVDGPLGDDFGRTAVDIREDGIEDGDAQGRDRQQHQEMEAAPGQVGSHHELAGLVLEEHRVEDELQGPRRQKLGDHLTDHGRDRDVAQLPVTPDVGPERGDDCLHRELAISGWAICSMQLAT